ncbi:epidermis-specific secreted glycoprotein EP1-like [Eucalyptus grandis]|uniref:epidermis-specific secreted glycoprotein EP1-like n=1 Tax=Eucalyptus grandis TaxID=71139 RepID=UPI00192ED41E|nr:epidermis-specific secreted glycoprotein EP1-like [Eucalyptus grandis]
MSSSLSLLHFLLLLSLSFLAQAIVPPSAQFKFVNEGEFGPYIVEYDGNYRLTSIGNAVFHICFYNTTPNAFTLALRMASHRSESLFRWVWEANRGNPVRENATFALGGDGNLVLADADGRVAWQSHTAKKGVVGLKLLPNGNMVLHDSKGNFVWQSFDSPTDTLLVGQSLRVGAVSKLVSRASEKDNSNGPYSLVIEPKQLSLYYTSKNSPKPLLYYTFGQHMYLADGSLAQVTLDSRSETLDGSIYDIILKYVVANKTSGDGLILRRPKYNSTLTILRLGTDGNLQAYTYYHMTDYMWAWDVTFSLFSQDGRWETQCQLPSRCGNFGLCMDSQCVACPSAHGLLGWSKSCAPPKVTSCRPGDFSYYKLAGVDHFLSKYTKGEGPMKEGDCRGKCNKDCKCLGYFYNQETSRCWIAYELKTLTKVANSTHVGYIKVPKK